MKAAGMRWRVASLSDLITCRMYHGGGDAVSGFTKNLFAAFDYRLLVYLFVFFWLAVLFWVPLIVLAARVMGLAPAARVDLLIVCLACSLLVWIVPYVEMGLPSYLGLLYPFTVLANEVVALRSFLFSVTGRLSWKDRTLSRPKWKWL